MSENKSDEKVWHSYQVGQLYDPEITRHPETMEVSLTRNGCQIILSLYNPTPEEIAAFDGRLGGPMKFGWIDAGGTGMLVLQTAPGMPFVSGYFHPMKQRDAANRGLPEPENSTPRSTLETLASTPLELGMEDGLVTVVGASDSKIKGATTRKEAHLVISMFLINARTGIIEAMRAPTWPPKFVEAVRETVDRLKSQPLDEAAEEAAVKRLDRSSLKELYWMSDAKCFGGQKE